MKSLWDFLKYIFETRDKLWRELLDTQNKYRNAWQKIHDIERENAELKKRLEKYEQVGRG